MKRTIGWLTISLAALATTSCGTVCNLAGAFVHSDKEPRVYGGVQRDVEVLDSVMNDKQSQGGPLAKDGGRSAAFGACLLICLCGADPILSFVADTLTLPITIPLQELRNARDGQGNAPPSVSANPNVPVPTAPLPPTPITKSGS